MRSFTTIRSEADWMCLQQQRPAACYLCASEPLRLWAAAVHFPSCGLVNAAPQPIKRVTWADAAAREGGGTAPESIGLDSDTPAAVCEAVPEAFLLQLGALLREEPSAQALAARGLPGAWGAPGSLYGVPDTDRCDAGGWELICEAASEEQTYWAWRRPLRAGLYLYRTHAVVEGATAAQLRRFQHDDAARPAWDAALLEACSLPLTDGVNARESGIFHFRARWPRPMASREYVYARRVWPRPSEGGCYSVSRACDHTVAPQPRGVRVRDFSAAVLIRGARSCRGSAQGIRKGLWSYAERFEATFRMHSGTAAGGSTWGLLGQRRKRAQAKPLRRRLLFLAASVAAMLKVG
ncbi:hypothetical protein WJX81_006833 [Elliptochloris bilobata]|uniref:START domain-containing protein n=1 Tax=Elliptochloris bilobata TaxID=381761 RepID=A0AAW1QGT9_9CHLO